MLFKYRIHVPFQSATINMDTATIAHVMTNTFLFGEVNLFMLSFVRFLLFLLGRFRVFTKVQTPSSLKRRRQWSRYPLEVVTILIATFRSTSSL